VTLSVLEAGKQHVQAEAVRIALIPGWSMPASIWQRQLEDLGKDFHVMALDPRGQGLSSVAESGYTAERRARDIEEFLHGSSNVVLVGWSLGAIESLQYIDQFGTHRLAGLVLVDSSVGEAPAPPSGGTFKQRLSAEREKMLEEFVRAIFARPRPEGDVAELVRQASRMPLQQSLALLSYPFERSHWRRIVHGFTKPLLYAVTLQYEAQARNLRRHRPATEVEIFKDAGHALFVDEPERFNVLLRSFIERLHSR
jgi:microsomal epoxide hydrolase